MTVDAPQQKKGAPGAIDGALNRYMSVPSRLGSREVTQAKIRALLEDFCQGDDISGYRGVRQIKGVTFEHIDKIVENRSRQ